MKNLKNIDVYDQILRGKEYKPAITIQDVPSLGRYCTIVILKEGKQRAV